MGQVRIVVTRPDGSPIQGAEVEVIGTADLKRQGSVYKTNNAGEVLATTTGPFFVKPRVTGERHRVMVTQVDASSVPITDGSGVFAATDVEAALAELYADILAHLNDTVDAHDASAVSNVPAGTVAATTVQAAIDELATDYAAADSAHVTSGHSFIDDNNGNTYVRTEQSADEDKIRHGAAGTEIAVGQKPTTNANPEVYKFLGSVRLSAITPRLYLEDTLQSDPAGRVMFEAAGDVLTIWRKTVAGDIGDTGNYEKVWEIDNATGLSTFTPSILFNGTYNEILGSLRGASSVSTKTIATGAITVDRWQHLVDTEGAAASDDLDTISGSANNALLLLSPAADARTVVIKHGTGNILCVGNADITMDDAHDFVMLWYSPALTKWRAAPLFGTGGGGGGSVATDAIWDAVGDIAVGTGANTAAVLPISVPAADIVNVPGVVNGETTLSYKGLMDATAPTTQAFGDAAAAGTGVKLARVTHKHAMPANPVTAHEATYIHGDIAGHIADAADAHDASAISILDTAGDFTATDVEGALAELQADAEAHLADTTNAHPHGSIDITGLLVSLVIRAESGNPRQSNPCAYPSVTETTTNLVDYVTCAFDAAAIEYWQSRGIPLPDNYDGGTFTARVRWATNDIGGGETVRWGIQLLIVADDGTIDTAFGTAQYAEDDVGSAVYDRMCSAFTSAITAAGSPGGTGRTLYVQVFRDATHVNDDLTSDALFESVELRFGVSALSA